MSNTSVYIPALLKFVDDKISIPSDVQEDIKKSIKLPFQYIENPSGFNYTLDSQKLLTKIKEADKDILKLEISIFYYHHRIIFNYNIINNNPLKTKFSSDVRKILTFHFEEKIALLINQINEGVRKCDMFESKEILNKNKIILYYSYPLIFQLYNTTLMDKLSAQLETMYFRIYLPNEKRFSYGTEAYIRISIPSYHVFYKGILTNEIVSNVINAIYQTVLYTKKTNDLKNLVDKIDIRKDLDIPFSKELLLEYNVVNEKTLTTIWEYSIDSMGGKISDNQQAKVSKTMFIVSMISLGIAFASIGLAIFLS